MPPGRGAPPRLRHDRQDAAVPTGRAGGGRGREFSSYRKPIPATVGRTAAPPGRGRPGDPTERNATGPTSDAAEPAGPASRPTAAVLHRALRPLNPLPPARAAWGAGG